MIYIFSFSTLQIVFIVYCIEIAASTIEKKISYEDPNSLFLFSENPRVNSSSS